jgi:hypothetical protein
VSAFLDCSVAIIGKLAGSLQAELVVTFLTSPLTPYTSPTFLDHLNVLCRQQPFDFLSLGLGRLNEGDPAAAIAAFNLSLERRGLLVVVAKFAIADQVDISTLCKEGLGWREDDSEAIMIAVAILRLVLGCWDETEIGRMAGLLTSKTIGKHDSELIFQKAGKNRKLLQLLIEVGKRSDPQPSFAFVELLRRIADGQDSMLATGAESLGLPLLPVVVSPA